MTSVSSTAGKTGPETLDQQGDAEHRREDQHRPRSRERSRTSPVEQRPPTARCSCPSTASSSRGRRHEASDVRRRSRAARPTSRSRAAPGGGRPRRAERERDEDREPDLAVGDVDEVGVAPVEQRREQVGAGSAQAAVRGYSVRSSRARRWRELASACSCPTTRPTHAITQANRPISSIVSTQHVSSSRSSERLRAWPRRGSGRRPRVGFASTPGWTRRRSGRPTLRTVDGGARGWAGRDGRCRRCCWPWASSSWPPRADGWVAVDRPRGAPALALVIRRRWPRGGCVPGPGAVAVPLAGRSSRRGDADLLLGPGISCLARWLPDPTRAAGAGAVLAAALRRLRASTTSDNDSPTSCSCCRCSCRRTSSAGSRAGWTSRAELLAQQPEQIRDQAVRDERDRIARELHDVIAHSVSAMVVQTAAAQDLVRIQPDRAAELLESVAEAGREALAETGRLLHLLRDEADELGLRPVPGLADVPGAGRDVPRGRAGGRASVDLPERPVPGGVDVSAYRVVQEALTNALKHGAGPVRLSVDGRRPTSCGSRCSNAVGPGRRERLRAGPAGHGGAGRAARRDAAPRRARRPASRST